MRQFLICLCAVYLIGSFQGVSTAAELEGLVVYFAFEEGAVEPDAKLPTTWGLLKQRYGVRSQSK